MSTPALFDRLSIFSATPSGPWRVVGQTALRGEALAPTSHLQVSAGPPPPDAHWSLSGVVSNERYVTRDEKQSLVAVQAPLGRADAPRAALIPIRKTPAWWAHTQDERRSILEESSRHIAIGLRYLPAVARRLHHCRDLPSPQPFDFLTWFEFSARDEPLFDALLAELRATAEWQYVDREVDLRLERSA